MRSIHSPLAAAILFTGITAVTSPPLIGDPQTMQSAPTEASLVAGPLRMKFADGELRYITVGDKEIVRRIYFSLRDPRWDTVASEFQRVDIQRKADSFRIEIKALVRRDPVNFQWEGEIVGTSSGRITYNVRGQAGADFRFNRFGLCVHYGAASLAGQEIELIDAAGKVSPSLFPARIQSELWSARFHTLRYTTSGGMAVSTTLSPEAFGMEDQRNFGDSSFKAFSGMNFPYPRITAGGHGEQTLTLEVKNAKPATAAATKTVVVEVGTPLANAKVPRFLPLDATAKKGFFNDLNKGKEQFKDAEVLAWPYCSAVNLFDDDTQFENLATIADQAATARAISRSARLRIAPVSFHIPYPRTTADPRDQTAFAAAWTAAAIKQLALAGVDEAMFDLAPGPGRRMLDELGAYSGSPILTEPGVPSHSPVEAFAVQSKESVVLWVVNTSPAPASANVRLPGHTAAAQQCGDRSSRNVSVRGGSLPVVLQGYDVCRVTVGSRIY